MKKINDNVKSRLYFEKYFSEDSWFNYKMGQLFVESNQSVKSIVYLDKAHQLDKNNLDLLNDYAFTLQLLKRYEESNQVLLDSYNSGKADQKLVNLILRNYELMNQPEMADQFRAQL